MSSGVWAYDSIFNKVTSRVTDEMFTWNTHHACSPGALVKILVKMGKKCYKADFFRIVT